MPLVAEAGGGPHQQIMKKHQQIDGRLFWMLPWLHQQGLTSDFVPLVPSECQKKICAATVTAGWLVMWSAQRLSLKVSPKCRILLLLQLLLLLLTKLGCWDAISSSAGCCSAHSVWWLAGCCCALSAVAQAEVLPGLTWLLLVLVCSASARGKPCSEALSHCSEPEVTWGADDDQSHVCLPQPGSERAACSWGCCGF